MDKSNVIRRLTRMKPLADVLAVAPGAGRAAAQADPAELARRLDIQSSEAQADLTSLQEAGWTFDAPDEAPPASAFQVVLDADGHLKLAGKLLTVKLRPDLDRAAIDALFRQMTLEVRRELGFAPNTFVVAVQEGSVLDCARALNERDEVLYAEPNLVEAVKSRRDL